MPMVAALLPRASFLARPLPLLPSIASLSGLDVSHLFAPFGPSKTRLHAVLACAAVPFNEFDAEIRSKSRSSKKSPLLNLIGEIEHMDVSHIQKDVPPNTVDEMKRTISSMLGLLPSSQLLWSCLHGRCQVDTSGSVATMNLQKLHFMKSKHSALEMQQFVGEEKDELLDYLRSLQPEKVAEISDPTYSEVEDVIHSVVHGLLATLSPNMKT